MILDSYIVMLKYKRRPREDKKIERKEMDKIGEKKEQRQIACLGWAKINMHTVSWAMGQQSGKPLSVFSLSILRASIYFRIFLPGVIYSFHKQWILLFKDFV
jgi:hypothetical protein